MNTKVLALAALGALSLCASCADKNKPARVVTTVYNDIRVINRVFTDDGLILERYDINQDGQIDNFTYLQPMDEYDMDMEVDASMDPREILNVRVVRKELDLNFDGSIDVIRYYNRRGVPFREELDTDFDGTFDRNNFYDGARTTRRDVDADGDGVAEERRYYTEGSLFRIERDTLGAGKPDTWEFYERDRLVRVGRDLDGDSIIDSWTQIRTERDRPGVMSARGDGQTGASEGEPSTDEPSEDTDE